MNAIVILNYNTSKDTITCHKSIRDTYGNDILIIIVDNKSTDESFTLISNRFKDEINTIIVSSEINGGYAAGNNIGIKKALEYNVDGILVSNSDIIFKENSINDMVNFALSSDECGIVAPKTLNTKGECSTLLRKRSLNLWSVLILSSILKSVFKKSRSKYVYDPIKIIDTTEVEVISGSCFYMKTEVIREIGLLDENTFLFAEEYILERKMSKTKFKTYYLPKAVVIHNHGVSTKKNYNFSYTKSVESLLYYCYRYLELNKVKLKIFLLVKEMEFIKRNIFKTNFFANVNSYRKTIKQYYKQLIEIGTTKK